MYRSEAVTINREAKGFQCLCAHLKCPRYFETTKGIKDHARNTGHSWVGQSNVRRLENIKTARLTIFILSRFRMKVQTTI